MNSDKMKWGRGKGPKQKDGENLSEQYRDT